MTKPAFSRKPLAPLVGGTFLLLLVAPAMAATVQLKLEVTSEPGGGAVTELVIHVAASVDGGSTSFFLDHQGGALDNVHLSVAPLVSSTDPAISLDSASISFTANGNPIPADGLSVPGAPQQVEVRLAVSGVPSADLGQFSGSIRVEQGGIHEDLVTLTVLHEGAPTLTVAGAPNDAVTLELDTADFRHVFRIDAANETPVHGVTVLVDPFQGPRSIETDVTVAVEDQSDPTAQFDIPGLGSEQVTVSATLARTGTYTSTLTLVYNGARHPINITVNRTEATAGVAVTGLENVRDWQWLPWGGHDAVIQVTLHETAGVGEDLKLPVVSDLALKNGDDRSSAAYVGTYVIGVSPSTGPLDTIHLDPHAFVVVRLVIQNLRGTGEFQGKIEVQEPSGASASSDFTIFRKASVVVAAALILIGIAASILIRTLFTKQKQSTQQRQVLAVAREMADMEDAFQESGDLLSDEQTILVGYGKRLDDLIADLTTSQVDDPGPTLEEIGRNLELFRRWAVVHRKIVVLSDPSTFDQPLADIGAFLRRKGTDDATAKPIEDQLSRLEGDVQNEVKQVFLGEVQEFQKRLTAQAAASGQEVADKLLSQVKPALEAAAQRAETDLVAARQQFDAARRSFAVVLADELEHRVAPDAPIPPGFSNPADWSVLGAAVRELCGKARSAETVKVAVDAYENAARAYLTSVANHLKSLVDAELPDAPDPQHQQLDAISRDLEQALALVPTDLTQATARYRSAADKFDALPAPPALREATPDGVTLSTTAARGVGLVPDAPRASVGTGGPQLDPRERLRILVRRMRTQEIVLNVIVAMVALGVGLKALWVDDPTWGGFGAYLGAIAWGLGVQWGSKAALDFTTIRNQLGGESTTSTSP